MKSGRRALTTWIAGATALFAFAAPASAAPIRVLLAGPVAFASRDELQPSVVRTVARGEPLFRLHVGRPSVAILDSQVSLNVGGVLWTTSASRPLRIAERVFGLGEPKIGEGATTYCEEVTPATAHSEQHGDYRKAEKFAALCLIDSSRSGHFDFAFLWGAKGTDAAMAAPIRPTAYRTVSNDPIPNSFVEIRLDRGSVSTHPRLDFALVSWGKRQNFKSFLAWPGLAGRSVEYPFSGFSGAGDGTFRIGNLDFTILAIDPASGTVSFRCDSGAVAFPYTATRPLPPLLIYSNQ